MNGSEAFSGVLGVQQSENTVIRFRLSLSKKMESVR
jgi:hypothetical protein